MICLPLLLVVLHRPLPPQQELPAPVIAVLPIEGGQAVGTDSAAKAQTAGFFQTELAISGIRTVDRTTLDKVVEEQLRGRSGAIDRSTAQEIGRLTGATHVITGVLGGSIGRTIRKEVRGSLADIFGEKPKRRYAYFTEISMTSNISMISVSSGELMASATTSGVSEVRTEGSTAKTALEGVVTTTIKNSVRNLIDNYHEKLDAEVIQAVGQKDFAINVGARHGVRKDQNVEIFENTGAGGLYQERKKVGEGRIVDVQELACKIEVKKLERNMKVSIGNRIKLLRKR